MNSEKEGLTEKMFILKEQLSIYLDMAREAKYKIINEDISNYPIFVAHQDEINIGIPLLDREKVQSIWSINASTLEEFYTKKLIQDEKLDEFRNLYNNHKNEICFFVLSEVGAQYLFIPT